MNIRMRSIVLSLMVSVILLAAGPAAASLTGFQTFVGNVAVSSDGFGDAYSSSGIISADVPAGSTVIAAYLYTSISNMDAVTPLGAGNTLAGVAVSYTALPQNTDACCTLNARRADVTSIIKPLIDGGSGGIYNFNITESNTGNQDGEALVVVYSNPTLGTNTVGLLDGFAATAGDTTSINFANPLDPTATGFAAEMRLGIGYSYDEFGPEQTSTVNVNGTTITENAGNYDDGNNANGGLITVGGIGDPFSALLPGVFDDHERYNLVPYITAGDTSIVVDTFNTSSDDNIFLAIFQVSGIAGINEPPNGVPEPTTLALLGMGLLGLAWGRKHRS